MGTETMIKNTDPTEGFIGRDEVFFIDPLDPSDIITNGDDEMIITSGGVID